MYFSYLSNESEEDQHEYNLLTNKVKFYHLCGQLLKY